MTETAAPPHPWTKRFTRRQFVVSLLALAVTATGVTFGALNYFRASAQTPSNAIVGDMVTGHRDISVTTDPNQAGPVVGRENSMTVCPGAAAPGQSVIGTYIGPGASEHVTVTANGSGSATGLRSTVTVGGAGCK
jgi:hypothetical protein